MPLTESGSHIAIAIWAVTWLPGLVFAALRMEHLLRMGRVRRALVGHMAILLVPVLAFGVYALSDAQRYAAAHSTTVSWGSMVSVALVAIPFAAEAAYLLAALRPGIAHPSGKRWLRALLLGLLSVLVFAPGLFMAQLMVFVGN
ncbi:MAG TPA: hypothetical protein VFW84_02645 [Aquabacterium sp.]|uniref:hypothetical protein n=1 Tax=Aquabacterium sp. TaxID=1872578 RepID=UPI002E30744D|nr:hypothetical protein [Aquabacterium sp.]HEX5371611.1 hypothetical protein [Aquabacterium sp.]